MRSALTAALLIAVALPNWALPVLAETTTPAAETAAPSELPAITVLQVASRKMEDHVLASGMIGPVQQVMVPPLIEGQPIETLLADVGDTVTAGQVLATLSTATLTLQKSQLLANEASIKASIAQADAQLADAKSTAADAQRTADRSAALFKQGSTSSAANDAAQTAATSAGARVAVAEQARQSALAQQDVLAAQIANIDLQLNRANIVAPVAGLIAARNAEIGAIASGAGKPLFTIIRDGALELSADVAEADLPRIAAGMPATLTLAASDAVLSGTIRLVGPTIDTNSRLGNARITIDANPAVRSGMFAEADILVVSRDTLAVPVTAVGQSGKDTTVMVVKDGVVTETPVTTGIRDQGWVEIASGLAAGDTIVAKAGAFVSNGDKINPILSETN